MKKKGPVTLLINIDTRATNKKCSALLDLLTHQALQKQLILNLRQEPLIIQTTTKKDWTGKKEREKQSLRKIAPSK